MSNTRGSDQARSMTKREYVATKILAGQYSDYEMWRRFSVKEHVENAIELTDALIKGLNNG